MDQQLKAIEQRMNRLQDKVQCTTETDSIHMVKENDSRKMYTSSVKLKNFDRTNMKQLQTEPLKPKPMEVLIQKSPVEIKSHNTHYFDYIDKTPILIQSSNPFNL